LTELKLTLLVHLLVKFFVLMVPSLFPIQVMLAQQERPDLLALLDLLAQRAQQAQQERLVQQAFREKSGILDQLVRLELLVKLAPRDYGEQLAQLVLQALLVQTVQQVLPVKLEQPVQLVLLVKMAQQVRQVLQAQLGLQV
jgi:hypothetical protein